VSKEPTRKGDEQERSQIKRLESLPKRKYTATKDENSRGYFTVVRRADAGRGLRDAGRGKNSKKRPSSVGLKCTLTAQECIRKMSLAFARGKERGKKGESFKIIPWSAGREGDLLEKTKKKK